MLALRSSFNFFQYLFIWNLNSGWHILPVMIPQETQAPHRALPSCPPRSFLCLSSTLGFQSWLAFPIGWACRLNQI
jgi:hypothetical protein